MPKYCLGFRSSAEPDEKTVLNDEVVQDLSPARGELPLAEPGTAQRSMILVTDFGRQRKNRIVLEPAPAPCCGEIAIGAVRVASAGAAAARKDAAAGAAKVPC